MTVPKGSPREGGAASEASRGGGGRYEEAGPASKCRARKESPIFIVSRETIFHLSFILLFSKTASKRPILRFMGFPACRALSNAAFKACRCALRFICSSASVIILICFNNILSTTYNFLRGLELIIRLSIYSDLFFTHLSKSIARSESLTVIGWFLPV